MPHLLVAGLLVAVSALAQPRHAEWRYYAGRGEEERATPCFLAAAEAKRPAGKSELAAPLSGRYFGWEGRTLHTWEFRADSSFSHTWAAAGAGASVRHSEQGVWELAGAVLELRTAGGFAAPGVGGRSTIAGGASDRAREVRRTRVEITADGLTLDGVKLKPKGW